MNPRIWDFAAALTFIAGWRYWVFRRTGKNGALFVSPCASQYQVLRLLWASFLTLFLELAVIRWIAVEIRLFAYIKNLALLLCFLGFGLGCALPNRAVRWFTALMAFVGLVVVIRLPWRGNHLEHLSQALGASCDAHFWGTNGFAASGSKFLAAAAFLAIGFWLISQIFLPLGRVVSRQMDLAPSSLHAYSWNLVGSLAGIVAFSLASRASLPPTIWLGGLIGGEGRPNAVDLIKAGRIHLIINTPHGPDPYLDEKAIRRASVAARIPTITTLSKQQEAGPGFALNQRTD